MSETQQLHIEAMSIASEAILAEQSGDNTKYIELTQAALDKEKKAAWNLFTKIEAEPTRSVLFRSAAWLAFNCGQYREAEQLIAAAIAGNPPNRVLQELRYLHKEILNALEPEERFQRIYRLFQLISGVNTNIAGSKGMKSPSMVKQFEHQKSQWVKELNEVLRKDFQLEIVG